MKNFFVSSNVGGNELIFRNEINVGIAPGKFDTKQLILSAIVVLLYQALGKTVRFVRTIDKTTLSKCNLFINDDFTTMFPVIPSYHDIENTWNKNAKKIIKNYVSYDEESVNIIAESVKEKICDLESIDCIMELYEASNHIKDSFEDALRLTLKLIDKFIMDSIREKMFFLTIKSYVKDSVTNYITPSVYVQGWRSIVRNVDDEHKILYAVFYEADKCYRIESIDKQLIMKKYAKNMPGVCYSGRFFLKVTDMETALKVIEKLPKTINKTAENLA